MHETLTLFIKYSLNESRVEHLNLKIKKRACKWHDFLHLINALVSHHKRQSDLLGNITAAVEERIPSIMHTENVRGGRVDERRVLEDDHQGALRTESG